MTSDNLAAVYTLFVRLPGGEKKRGVMCLASTLTSHTKNNGFLNKPRLRIAQQDV
jgi:hypothetical protein